MEFSRHDKLNAYNEAIEHLKLCDSESNEERAAFIWLAEKLDKECQRWWKKKRQLNLNLPPLADGG